MRYFRFCHILFELSCKTQKASHQICVFSPQFRIGNGHCFLTKQFGQPSALNVWFHDWATSVTTHCCRLCRVPVTNLMRNQVADYHRTTGEADMCTAQGHVCFGPEAESYMSPWVIVGLKPAGVCPVPPARSRSARPRR